MVRSLLSRLRPYIPAAIMKRIQLISLLLVVPMIAVLAQKAVTTANAPPWLSVLLIALTAALIGCWVSWFRGRPIGPVDYAIEGAAIALIAYGIGDPVQAVALLYVGLVYRSYFSDRRQLFYGIGTTFIAFGSGITLSDAGLDSVVTAYILTQLPIAGFTAWIIYLYAHGMQTQAALVDELTIGKLRYQSLVESIPGVILTSTADGVLRYASPQLERLIGVNPDQLKDEGWASIVSQYIHPDDRDAVVAKLGQAIMDGESVSLECRAFNTSGQKIWVYLEGHLVDDGSPDAPFWQMLAFDVTEVHSLMDELTHQAFHDALTGLPNRALFDDRVEHALESARQHSTLTAVCFFDLDNFKVVNDSIGHKAGDMLIIEAANRLQRCMRSTDTIARFGGDEFALLLENLRDECDAGRLAERIIKDLSEPFVIEGHSIYTSASIGIVFFRDEPYTASQLIRFADVAMYESKRTGKARYTIFEPQMEDRAFRRLELEGELRQALERGEFRVAYQPIVDLASGEIREVEALVRWQHPTRGLLGPADFLEVSEMNGLIVPIGSWVLREACRQTHAWQRTHPRFANLVVSVNLSPRQLHEVDLITEVAAVLKETGLAPEHLQLEVAEDAMLADIEQAVQALTDLSTLGVEIAIDDFGTGNSSLGHLRRLPVQTMKIDRSYVAELGKSEQGTTMLRAMVTLAKTLGMDVTAEGIETIEQTGLHGFGCDFGQGFYFAEPLLSADMEDLLSLGSRYSVIEDQPSPLFPLPRSHSVTSNGNSPVDLLPTPLAIVPNGTEH